MEAVIIDGKLLALTHEAPIRLAPRSDELARFVTLVNELADFRRVGWVETIGRGHPVIGDVSASPKGNDVELRWPEQTLVVPASALLAALQAIAKARAPTSRHLFTDEPVAPVPDLEVEEAPLIELDAQIVELDRLEAAGDEAAASAKRRFVFDDLDFFGILTLRGHEARTFWLEHWGLAHVLELQRAALAAWTYYLGQQRAADLDNPFMPKRLLDGPFSLDWFRRPSVPPSPWTFERLTISSEATFRHRFEKADEAGGTYFFHSGRISGQYWFRTDFGPRPCLYRANVSLA